MKRHSFIYYFIAIVSLLSHQQVMAQEIDDENDFLVRENPEIDGLDEDFDMIIPSFIKENKNHIQYNGADWNHLRKEIHNCNSAPFSIVHIGDSHLQADYATAETRNLLQYDFGNAGRGLITPLRLAGTNQPRDFSFTSTKNWNSVKLMANSWPRTMGFTGVSISPSNSTTNITVATTERDEYNPFSALTVFHKGQFFVTSVTDETGNLIPFISHPSKDYTHIQLTKEVNSATLSFESAGDLTLFGVNLSGKRPGLFYHVIGNNGASYETYNRIGNEGEGISALNPNLVIISLGTNEAFGSVSVDRMKESIGRLVNNIKRSNPLAEILLVTPIECERSVYTSAKVKGKKGRKRTKRIKSYKVNDKIATVRQAIIEYGKENHIATYDWHDIAGGNGAAQKWIDKGLFSHDRVHHSVKGYQLQGFLLYQALHEALK